MEEIMKVKDIMTTPALSVGKNTDIYHVAKLISENDVGVIPVCDDNGNICGVITDRDIVLRAIGEGKDVKTTSASDIMTKDVTTVSPFTDLDDAFDIMSDIKVRRLPVVNESELVGMLTLGDLSQSLDYSFEVSDALCEVCKGCEKM